MVVVVAHWIRVWGTAHLALHYLVHMRDVEVHEVPRLAQLVVWVRALVGTQRPRHEVQAHEHEDVVVSPHRHVHSLREEPRQKQVRVAGVDSIEVNGAVVVKSVVGLAAVGGHTQIGERLARAVGAFVSVV